MYMKLIELESSLTLFICAHFRLVYVVRSAALNSPDYESVRIRYSSVRVSPFKLRMYDLLKPLDGDIFTIDSWHAFLYQKKITINRPITRIIEQFLYMYLEDTCAKQRILGYWHPLISNYFSGSIKI